MTNKSVKGEGGLSEADILMRPFELLSVVCTLGAVDCPLVEKERVQKLIHEVSKPACRIKFVTNADEVPYYDYEKTRENRFV